MTTSLQELIDDSIFMSTEHQARLAELSQGVDWDVDFSVPSFTLQSDPPVSLTPHLLGTDSAERGSWVWSWQELGHFPSEVVSAAVQSRESGTRAEVAELTTDELATRDGLARQLTLAAKALTGLWAHYPAQVGKQVTAWLLLEGPELELEPITLETMMRVIAEALQTGTAVDHNRALNSYARLRGMHIEWDTDAMCVITTRDGAQRFWFEEHQISGVEPAEPTVSQDELTRLEMEARTRREAMAADREDARRIAEEQADRDTAARAAEETSRREATAAGVGAGTDLDAAAQDGESTETTGDAAPTTSEQPLPAELSREDLEAPLPGSPADDADAPFDQEPRRDVAPGEVTTTTVPSLAEEREDEEVPTLSAPQATEAAGTQSGTEDLEHRGEEPQDREDFAAEAETARETPSAEPAHEAAEETTGQRPEIVQPRVEEPATARPLDHGVGEPLGESTEHEPDTLAAEDQDRETEREDKPRKKGFLSRFFRV